MRHGASKKKMGYGSTVPVRRVCVRVKAKWETGASREEDVYVSGGMAWCRRQDLASGQANGEDA